MNYFGIIFHHLFSILSADYYKRDIVWNRKKRVYSFSTYIIKSKIKLMFCKISIWTLPHSRGCEVYSCGRQLVVLWSPRLFWIWRSLGRSESRVCVSVFTLNSNSLFWNHCIISMSHLLALPFVHIGDKICSLNNN